MEQHLDVAIVPVEAGLLVADVLDGHAGRVGDPVLRDRGGTACLARDHNLIGRRKRLAGGADLPRIDPGVRALTIEKIDDLVRNAVTDLVGVPFRDGLAREKIVAASQNRSPYARKSSDRRAAPQEFARFCQPGFRPSSRLQPRLRSGAGASLAAGSSAIVATRSRIFRRTRLSLMP